MQLLYLNNSKLPPPKLPHMKKLFCFTFFAAAIQCHSQSYQTKFIEQPIVTLNCESFVVISDFKKIESNTSLFFHIKNGSFHISISGVIDKSSSSQIMISLYTKELLDEEMLIIATRDSQQIQYKVEGAGSGLYAGNLNDNDDYIVNTTFKLTAPDEPAHTLMIPLKVHVSGSGNNNLIRCFIDGTAYVYHASKKKSKTRNKKNI
jgi:hypothetical protein